MECAAKNILSITLHRFCWYAIFAIALSLFLTDPANATNNGGVLCNAASYAQNQYMRGLATIVVMGVGLGAIVGRVHWPVAITIAAGISILYAAGTITQFIAYNPWGAGVIHGCTNMS